MAESADNLKGRVLTALRWTATARFIAQFLTWAITLVVIRILEPRDYGLMAMCEAFFSLLLLLSSQGLSAALIQAKDVSERQVRQLFGVLLLVNAALFVALYFSAPLIALYYGEPRVIPISRALGIGFLILPFNAIPNALLSRDIDFRRKSIVGLIASGASAIAVLALAWIGMGVWALVAGRLLNFAISAVGLCIIRPLPLPPVFSFRAIGGLVKFGGTYTLAVLASVVLNQAPVLVAGRYLSAELVGYYAVGTHVATLTISKIMPLLNEVAFPAYARLQSNTSAVGYYFLKVVRIAAILAFPALIGLATVAPEFVRLILGDRYEQAILPLVLLCVVMPVRLISTLLPAAVNGVGRPGIVFVNKLIALAVMPAAFVIGVHWELAGLCIAWVAAFPVVFVVELYRAAPVIGIRKREVVAALAPIVGATALMAGVVLGVRQLLPAEFLASAWGLVTLILVGAASYVGYIWFVLRERVREVFKTLRN